ncbi:hypothetical protein GGTG_00779 [Gaeumannomyces tritici R3-111a-1]|uniref:Uncharacterized protein n=1 Tax=Gaeumannomyces tritici (strain R3-111a-1) TaxID=644352 RepID=J3NHP2_GAET3|nr:hypothetical protein GGTG_00779 [Gaeumannomyces tritici R3-111a-1]EJT80785.1 hypothetical protein GGTG_00779 [Gaeumannomyces tritici R3-111a-1]
MFPANTVEPSEYLPNTAPMPTSDLSLSTHTNRRTSTFRRRHPAHAASPLKLLPAVPPLTAGLVLSQQPD